MGCAALTGIFAAVAALPNHSCPYLQISGFNSVARWANWLARHWHATGCAACHLVDNLFSVLQNGKLLTCTQENNRGSMQAMIDTYRIPAGSLQMNADCYILVDFAKLLCPHSGVAVVMSVRLGAACSA